MNTPTPTPTPRTDAAIVLLCDLHGVEIDFARTLERELAETERLRFGADADRRRLRADVERWQGTAATMAQEREHNANVAQAIAAERDQLRAEVEHFKFLHQCESESSVAAFARAYRAEAELATERARLDWVFRNCKVMADDFTTGNRDVYAIHDREDLGAAMKEDAK
jgi:hypothetical protein